MDKNTKFWKCLFLASIPVLNECWENNSSNICFLQNNEIDTGLKWHEDMQITQFKFLGELLLYIFLSSASNALLPVQNMTAVKSNTRYFWRLQCSTPDMTKVPLRIRDFETFLLHAVTKLCNGQWQAPVVCRELLLSAAIWSLVRDDKFISTLVTGALWSWQRKGNQIYTSCPT